MCCGFVVVFVLGIEQKKIYNLIKVLVCLMNRRKNVAFKMNFTLISLTSKKLRGIRKYLGQVCFFISKILGKVHDERVLLSKVIEKL